MIVEAIDKRTGRTVRAENAYSGQRLECPYCGVDVHPVLGVETPFYRCYEGGEHTNYICKQLDRTNRVGKRVLALRPRWPVNRSNAILFAAFSTDRKTNVRKKKNFVLVFDDRREYNQACKKLFVRNTESSGISSTAPK